MIWPYGETVTVGRRTGVTFDGDGNDVPVFTDTTYEGVPVGPGTTVELTQGQDLLTDELHAYFQPAIPLTATDRVTVTTGLNAGVYDVDGKPKQYNHPRTNTSITDAKLIKAAG